MVKEGCLSGDAGHWQGKNKNKGNAGQPEIKKEPQCSDTMTKCLISVLVKRICTLGTSTIIEMLS